MSYIRVTQKQKQALKYLEGRFLLSLSRRGSPSNTEILQAIEIEKLNDSLNGVQKIKFPK